MAAREEPFSDDFITTTRAEADRLRDRARELRQQAEQYQATVERLAIAALAFERQAQELDEILGRAPQLRLDVPEHGLSGQRLREAAVEALARSHGLNEPIHYREWFALLEAEGVTVSGRDPLATFLTQVTRSPVVERAAGRAGVYLLNPGEAGREAMDDVRTARSRLDIAIQRRAEAQTMDDQVRIGSEQLRVDEARRWLGAAEKRLAEVARTQTTLRSIGIPIGGGAEDNARSETPSNPVGEDG